MCLRACVHVRVRVSNVSPVWHQPCGLGRRRGCAGPEIPIGLALSSVPAALGWPFAGLVSRWGSVGWVGPSPSSSRSCRGPGWRPSVPAALGWPLAGLFQGRVRAARGLGPRSRWLVQIVVLPADIYVLLDCVFLIFVVSAAGGVVLGPAVPGAAPGTAPRAGSSASRSRCE